MKYWILHDNDPDGHTAAVIVKQYLGGKYGTIIPIAVTERGIVPEIVFSYMSKEDEIFLLDISYCKETIILLLDICSRVTIIDHHKTTIEELEELCDDRLIRYLDVNYSTAMLAWKYFNGYVTPPLLVDLVNDMDLFKYALDGTSELAAYLGSKPVIGRHTLPLYDILLNDDGAVDQALEKGKGLLRIQQQQIDEFVAQHSGTIWGTDNIKYMMFDQSPLPGLYSKISERLYLANKDIDFVLSYLKLNDTTYKYSLRAGKHNDFDVTTICSMYGGGGHAKAGGFTADKDPMQIVRDINDEYTFQHD